MALNFVAVDFEIAASKWDTVCSVALVRISNGIIVDEFSTLIDPECEFGPIQMRVHGITPLMVAGAPVFPEVAQQVLDFIGEDVLVAHNVPFDGGVLYRVFDKYSLSLPEIRTFCSLACANIYLPHMKCHKLPTICREYGVKLVNHHDAAADARACAQIMIEMAAAMEVDSLEEIAAQLHIEFGYVDAQGAVSPRMTDGSSPYAHGKHPTDIISNPYSLLEELKSKCPEFSNEITMELLKDGRTHAFKSVGSLAFYLVVGKQSPFVKVKDVKEPEAITQNYSTYKDGMLKLPIADDFNCCRFIDDMAERCRYLYEQAASDKFGCCNDFLICSDVGYCIKAKDLFYMGCLYRKNLEAGRIFYGKNKTI